MATTVYDREGLEAMKGWERPLARCRIDRVNIDEDGRRTETVPHSFMATIAVDGNNPWLVAQVASKGREFRVDWGLLLEVLNDKYAAPIHFLGQVAEYEV
jgi:hypothetical protein